MKEGRSGEWSVGKRKGNRGKVRKAKTLTSIAGWGDVESCGGLATSRHRQPIPSGDDGEVSSPGGQPRDQHGRKVPNYAKEDDGSWRGQGLASVIRQGIR